MNEHDLRDWICGSWRIKTLPDLRKHFNRFSLDSRQQQRIDVYQSHLKQILLADAKLSTEIPNSLPLEEVIAAFICLYPKALRQLPAFISLALAHAEPSLMRSLTAAINEFGMEAFFDEQQQGSTRDLIRVAIEYHANDFLRWLLTEAISKASYIKSRLQGYLEYAVALQADASLDVLWAEAVRRRVKIDVVALYWHAKQFGHEAIAKRFLKHGRLSDAMLYSSSSHIKAVLGSPFIAAKDLNGVVSHYWTHSLYPNLLRGSYEEYQDLLLTAAHLAPLSVVKGLFEKAYKHNHKSSLARKHITDAPKLVGDMFARCVGSADDAKIKWAFQVYQQQQPTSLSLTQRISDITMDCFAGKLGRSARHVNAFIGLWQMQSSNEQHKLFDLIQASLETSEAVVSSHYYFKALCIKQLLPTLDAPRQAVLFHKFGGYLLQAAAMTDDKMLYQCLRSQSGVALALTPDRDAHSMLLHWALFYADEMLLDASKGSGSADAYYAVARELCVLAIKRDRAETFDFILKMLSDYERTKLYAEPEVLQVMLMYLNCSQIASTVWQGFTLKEQAHIAEEHGRAVITSVINESATSPMPFLYDRRFIQAIFKELSPRLRFSWISDLVKIRCAFQLNVRSESFLRWLWMHAGRHERFLIAKGIAGRKDIIIAADLEGYDTIAESYHQDPFWLDELLQHIDAIQVYLSKPANDLERAAFHSLTLQVDALFSDPKASFENFVGESRTMLNTFQDLRRMLSIFVGGDLPEVLPYERYVQNYFSAKIKHLFQQGRGSCYAKLARLASWQDIRKTILEQVGCIQALVSPKAPAYLKAKRCFEKTLINLFRHTQQEPDQVASTLMREVEVFTLLTRLSLRLETMRSQYTGKNKARLASLDSIELALSVCLDDYTARKPVGTCLGRLESTLFALYRAVLADHKMHGRLSFLGSWQPASRLCRIMMPNVQLVHNLREQCQIKNP